MLVYQRVVTVSHGLGSSPICVCPRQPSSSPSMTQAYTGAMEVPNLSFRCLCFLIFFQCCNWPLNLILVYSFAFIFFSYLFSISFHIFSASFTSFPYLFIPFPSTSISFYISFPCVFSTSFSKKMFCMFSDCLRDLCSVLCTDFPPILRPQKAHRARGPLSRPWVQEVQRRWMCYHEMVGCTDFESFLFFWGFPKIGAFPPKWMVKIIENPIKMDDLGGKPLFSETSIYLDLLDM